MRSQRYEERTLFDAVERNDLAAVRYNIEELKIPIDICDSTQATALHRAAAKGYESIVAYLISQRAQIEAANAAGYTPWCEAIANGHLPIAGLLERFGAHGDFPNERVRHFVTVKAATSGHLESIRYLIKSKIDFEYPLVDSWLPPRKHPMPPRLRQSLRKQQPTSWLLFQLKLARFQATVKGEQILLATLLEIDHLLKAEYERQLQSRLKYHLGRRRKAILLRKVILGLRSKEQEEGHDVQASKKFKK